MSDWGVGYILSERDSRSHTFGSAAEQDVNASKYFYSFGHRRYTGAHVAITSNAPNAVLPTFPVLAVALAFRYQLSKLGATLLMVDFLWR
jgi:hypothetical protein